MMDEQKLADIRARCKAEAYVVVSRDEFGGRHEDECWQAIEDVDTLLRMFDQQQAVIDAALSVDAVAQVSSTDPDLWRLLDALHDALDGLNGSEPDAAGLSADKTDPQH